MSHRQSHFPSIHSVLMFHTHLFFMDYGLLSDLPKPLTPCLILNAFTYPLCICCTFTDTSFASSSVYKRWCVMGEWENKYRNKGSRHKDRASRWVANFWPQSSLSSVILCGNMSLLILKKQARRCGRGLSASSNHKQQSKESPIWKIPQEKNDYLNSAGVEERKNNASPTPNPLFLSLSPLYWCHRTRQHQLTFSGVLQHSQTIAFCKTSFPH